MNSQVQVLIRLRADEERTPTHSLFVIDLRLSFLFMLKVYAFKVTSF